MAKAFKIRVFYLLFEFFTHTLVFRCMFSAAGAIAAGAFETLLDYLDDFFVGIECDLHSRTSVYGIISIFAMINRSLCPSERP